MLVDFHVHRLSRPVDQSCATTRRLAALRGLTWSAARREWTASEGPKPDRSNLAYPGRPSPDRRSHHDPGSSGPRERRTAHRPRRRGARAHGFRAGRLEDAVVGHSRHDRVDVTGTERGRKSGQSHIVGTHCQARPKPARSSDCGSPAPDWRGPTAPPLRYIASLSANQAPTSATSSGSIDLSAPVAAARSQPWIRWSAHSWRTYSPMSSSPYES